MKNLFIIIFLSVLVGCNISQKKEIKLVKGKAIVEGKVINFGNESKIIEFSGETIIGDIAQNEIIDSLGNFKTEIELINSQNVYFEYANGWTYLYLRPNDSVFVTLDKDLWEEDYYEITGTNSTTSENIRDFLKYHGLYSFQPKYGDSVSVQEYLSSLKQELKIEDSILTEFSKLYNPNDDFLRWSKAYTKYGMAGNLLLYYWHFDVNRQKLKPEIYDAKTFPVDDDSAIITGEYIVYLKNYLMAKYYRDPAITKYAEKDEVSAATKYIFEKLLKNENPSLSRDIMLYNIYLNVLETPFDGRDTILNKYETHLNNKVLVNLLHEKKHISDSGEKINETTLDLMSKTKSDIVEKFWETLSTKHRGKTIYIDIWATWCGPCRGEIPYAIDLHDYFEGKSVSFVNLCLASKKEDWKKFIAQNHIKGDNYFFNEDETKLLRDELKFHGYPTYMIIDKEGKLVDKNAPRPSTGKTIIDLLDKLIEE